MDPLDNKTGTEPEAANSGEANTNEVKTVHGTEPEAANSGEVKTNDDANESGNDDANESGNDDAYKSGNDDAYKSGNDDADKSGNDDADKSGNDDADELDDAELEALDAKVRRRVNKVQRENVNLRTRLKDAEADHGKVQRENERLAVALNAGLSGEHLKFLTGETVDELEKNAADLLAVIGYNGRVTPSAGPTENGANPRRGGIDPASAAANETNLDTIGARIFKR